MWRSRRAIQTPIIKELKQYDSSMKREEVVKDLIGSRVVCPAECGHSQDCDVEVVDPYLEEGNELSIDVYTNSGQGGLNYARPYCETHAQCFTTATVTVEYRDKIENGCLVDEWFEIVDVKIDRNPLQPGEYVKNRSIKLGDSEFSRLKNILTNSAERFANDGKMEKSEQTTELKGELGFKDYPALEHLKPEEADILSEALQNEIQVGGDKEICERILHQLYIRYGHPEKGYIFDPDEFSLEIGSHQLG